MPSLNLKKSELSINNKKQPLLVAMDLEGCLIPEIWAALAEKTKVSELALTTRDIADYDALMGRRLALLQEHKLRIQDIENIISSLAPLEGAKEFLYCLRSLFPFVILSDTFYEFASAILPKLDYPTLFCHRLGIDEHGTIRHYYLRSLSSKAGAVQAFQENGFFVVAIGDSYNDIEMLQKAQQGILFHAPKEISGQFSHLPSYHNYQELKEAIGHIARMKL